MKRVFVGAVLVSIGFWADEALRMMERRAHQVPSKWRSGLNSQIARTK